MTKEFERELLSFMQGIDASLGTLARAAQLRIGVAHAIKRGAKYVLAALIKHAGDSFMEQMNRLAKGMS